MVEKLDDQNPEIVPEPETDGVRKKKKKKKTKKKKENGVDETISEIRKSSDEESDLEETDFWMPPVGERWDFDEGGDRWGSGSESENEDDEVDGAGMALVVNKSIVLIPFFVYKNMF